MPYKVVYKKNRPVMNGLWDSSDWLGSNILEIGNFRQESSAHRPITMFRLVYSDKGLSGIFKVTDRFVRCLNYGYNVPVYKDSCVEFFVKPHESKGYFNFEFNCGGSLLCSYITDHERTPNGFKESVFISEDDLKTVEIFHSLPARLESEIEFPVEWILQFFIPFGLLEKYCGSFYCASGHTWKCNLYKCGDDTSHPHWASWKPVPLLNFHLPQCFGDLFFESPI